jgi:hypothetical protein
VAAEDWQRGGRRLAECGRRLAECGRRLAEWGRRLAELRKIERQKIARVAEDRHRGKRLPVSQKIAKMCLPETFEF